MCKRERERDPSPTLFTISFGWGIYTIDGFKGGNCSSTIDRPAHQF